MTMRWRGVASGVSMALSAVILMLACGGNSESGAGSGGSGASAGVGGGGGAQCGGCSLPLIHEGDSCSTEGDCCSYGGQCPLVFGCNGGEWEQLASSSCGYAVPCGDQGLGCRATEQCISDGTSHSCGPASDAGSDADAPLPACTCFGSPPTSGEACACSGPCTYLICPAGEQHTIDCVDGKWAITGYAWDYYCGDAG